LITALSWGAFVTELHFKGKEFVYNHHLTVPHRPLVMHADKGIGAPRKDGCDRPVPNVTLKVTTGGGKTYLAAQSISRIMGAYLTRNTGFVLWVVPNEAIYSQTLRPPEKVLCCLFAVCQRFSDNYITFH
jgi:hypothetical protein